MSNRAHALALAFTSLVAVRRPRAPPLFKKFSPRP